MEFQITTKTDSRKVMEIMIASMDALPKVNEVKHITLHIPPKTSFTKIINMLTTELGICRHVENVDTRRYLHHSIKEILKQLKHINRIPDNGLIFYSVSGNNESEIDSEITNMTYKIIPLKPVTRCLFICDNRFHTDFLREMLASE